MNDKSYAEINAETIDRWVEDGWEWGIPISHEAYTQAKQGEWSVFLTPQIPTPQDWFSPYMTKKRLEGVKMLGLASGGAQQMPVFAALGADVTVLDYAEAQLQSEREVAQREGYAIEIVKADMSKPLPFADESFDLIFHPVSNCYVEDVYHIWNECFRTLRPGGVLLAGMDNGFNFLVDDISVEPLVICNKLPYNPLKDECLLKKSLEKGDGVQFSHSLEEQIGGQLRAGFQLTALYEDRDASGALAQYAPQYIATRSIKPS